MPQWFSDVLEKSSFFMPHGHCYLWIPSLLWIHVLSDALIGIAYVGISLLLYLLIRKIRLPFSPVFIAFGLFIGLCGITHFMSVWTVWNPDYFIDGLIKAATAAASVLTAIGLIYIRPQVEEVVHTARLSEERRIQLESTNAELTALYAKVTQLDELKSHFFSNVSHELRTPLALILGPAERITGDTNLTQDQKRQLEGIARNGRSLLKQVNDLLDVAKIEAGKMLVQYSRVDCAALIRLIASQFEIAAQQRQIRFEVSAPESLITEVDPDMLERVVINLLSNAFKFTPEGGEVQLFLQAEHADMRITVADTGLGISEDQHQAIFERFRQADGGATRKHGGTGLGLAIAKDVIALHGGRIEVSSKLEHGSKFDVYLPLSAPQGAVIRESSAELEAATQVALLAALNELGNETDADALNGQWAQRPDSPTVLVVEDNPEMSNFIANPLAREYNVITAGDGKEGLERALALRPDLIVTDVMMPRMSGDQLVTELRSRSELDATPIIFLTAKADDELRVKLLRSGAQDYLTKPFSTQELLARAGNLIAMKRVGDTLREELASASGDLEGMARQLSIKHRELQTALDLAEVAKQQAQQANQVKGDFLGMISHELRTPLATIHMSTAVLARLNKDSGSETHDRALERLTRATRQMSTLIEGLLQYTRAESGRIQMHLESVDTWALAREVVESHAEYAPAEVALRIEAPAPSWGPILTDPRLLRVILNNLVSNALKFTRQGSITVQLKTWEGGQSFEIHDTGIGIPEADLPRIFLRFEQLEPVQRKHIPGVGLGLALVKSLVEMLNGIVEVESIKGQGSTFRVRIPRHPHAPGHTV